MRKITDISQIKKGMTLKVRYDGSYYYCKVIQNDDGDIRGRYKYVGSKENTPFTPEIEEYINSEKTSIGLTHYTSCAYFDMKPVIQNWREALQ